jgi:CubicO group peptidase (beta-lactamase class C family)
VTASLCGAAQPKATIIDTLMHRLSARGQFTGSVLVAENGTAIYEGGFGKAVDPDMEFTPVTPCYLASLSKQFTAMAVMMLMERGKLAYDDPLSKYFPDLPPDARKIIIRQLLNHTSGIPDYVGLGLEHPGLTNTEVLAALAKQDVLDFPPGSKYHYSNSGYVLLAVIIEKVSGEPYALFLKQNIFDRIGMTHTFVDDGSHAGLPPRARGYNRFGANDDYNLATCGEGGIYASVQDMFAWDHALYTDTLVKRSTLSEAFSRPQLTDGTLSAYGFGWGISEYDGAPVASHAGRYGGFNTYIKRFPRDRNAVIFLTNHGFRNMSAIGNAIVNILYDQPYALPKLSVADEMFAITTSKGLPAALERYHALKRANDTSYSYQESELNELGYQFLEMKKFDEAIAVLKLNVEAFPASANVYDGLGEAYMKHGDDTLATENYTKSLKLDPNNANAAAMLKKLGSKPK